LTKRQAAGKWTKGPERNYSQGTAKKKWGEEPANAGEKVEAMVGSREVEKWAGKILKQTKTREFRGGKQEKILDSDKRTQTPKSDGTAGPKKRKRGKRWQEKYEYWQCSGIQLTMLPNLGGKGRTEQPAN